MGQTSDEWLKLEEVAFSRGRKPVFQNLSLTCSERRIGLLGDNGAGKSTFLRLLNGLLSPQQGRLQVVGLNPASDVSEAMRAVGFVFQNPDHQIVFPTVLEEMSFGFRTRGLTRAESSARALEWLDRYGCAHWAELSVDELSDGQRQKLCIMSVLALEPSVIALDEPFSSLDLSTRLELADLLARAPQHLIIASHDLDLLQTMERLIWLDQGRIIADGAPGDVVRLYVESCRRHARRRGMV